MSETSIVVERDSAIAIVLVEEIKTINLIAMKELKSSTKIETLKDLRSLLIETKILMRRCRVKSDRCLFWKCLWVFIFDSYSSINFMQLSSLIMLLHTSCSRLYLFQWIWYWVICFLSYFRKRLSTMRFTFQDFYCEVSSSIFTKSRWFDLSRL